MSGGDETGRDRVRARNGARTILVAGALMTVMGPWGCDDRSTPGRAAEPRADTPPRIVSLLPGATEIVVELGGRELLVARSEGDPATEGLLGLPPVGDPLAPSLEVLVDVRPDLVLAWAGGSSGELRRTLPPDGSLVLLEILDFQDLRAAIDTVAALLGRGARGRALVRRLDDELNRARRIAESRSAEHRPTVAWIVWPEPLTLAGPGTFIDDALAYAGGANVVEAGEGSWPTLSFEALVDRNPDVVVWPRGGGIPDPAAAAGVWSRLPAFRGGRVIRIPADRFHVPGPGLGGATVQLARELRHESLRGRVP